MALTHFRHPTTGEWTVIEASDPSRVSKFGDVMTGALGMSNQQIYNVGAPTAYDHAVNKNYVDTRRAVTVISGAITLPAEAGRHSVYVASGASAYNVTLPTAVDNTSMYTIKRTATANVTVVTTASQTIDGATSFVIGTRYQSIDLVSDGANWVVI